LDMNDAMKSMQKWLSKNKDNCVSEKVEKIIIIVLVGVFFLVAASPVNGLSDKKNVTIKQDKSSPLVDDKKHENDEYIAYLENKLEEIIEGMEGAGKTEVMITLKNHGEKIVDKNQPYENETHKELDDNKNIENTKVQSEQETVLIEQDGNTTPYVIMEYYPQIEGVVVVCDGGENKKLELDIKNMVQALFDLDINKICVCKRKNKNEVK